MPLPAGTRSSVYWCNVGEEWGYGCYGGGGAGGGGRGGGDDSQDPLETATNRITPQVHLLVMSNNSWGGGWWGISSASKVSTKTSGPPADSITTATPTFYDGETHSDTSSPTGPLKLTRFRPLSLTQAERETFT